MQESYRSINQWYNVCFFVCNRIGYTAWQSRQPLRRRDWAGVAVPPHGAPSMTLGNQASRESGHWSLLRPYGRGRLQGTFGADRGDTLVCAAGERHQRRRAPLTQTGMPCGPLSGGANPGQEDAHGVLQGFCLIGELGRGRQDLLSPLPGFGGALIDPGDRCRNLLGAV